MKYLIISLVILSMVSTVIVVSPLLTSITAPPSTPWHCIGGCGLGGSGGSGASNIRWIGKGVQGYLLTVECLPQLSMGSDYGTLMIVPHIAFHPNWNTHVGLTLPVGYKIAEVQYQTNLPDQLCINGGPGDITAVIERTFGNEGAFSAQLACTFPTGDYDARYGAEQSKKLLPNELQMGCGVYNASIRFTCSHPRENGIALLDATIHYPFIIRFDKKNEYLATDYQAYRDVNEYRERFHYRYPIKPYGESDRGDYYPPSLQIGGAYSWFHDASITHSLQATITAYLGTRWVHHYDINRYDPYPDPDHRAWSSLFVYGIEFSRFRFPVFAGFGIPVHDRRGSNNKWDGIDAHALFKEWIFTLGFTAGFF